jgi:hypothetical protein
MPQQRDAAIAHAKSLGLTRRDDRGHVSGSNCLTRSYQNTRFLP